MKRIGIIGGSGLTHFDELSVQERLNCKTPWGEPSSPLLIGSLQQQSSGASAEVLFLARHGEEHQIPPHKVNYRANIAALKKQRVTAIFAVNVVGGINREMCPGDLIIPDQIIDYTWGREHTYSDGINSSGMSSYGMDSNGVGSDSAGENNEYGNITSLQHVDFTYPYDENLRNHLLEAALTLDVSVHADGVYGATQGPRLETAAEITRMNQDGCDIVGMTGMPEAALAREMGIPYVSLALVVNMAAGLSDEIISMEQIRQILHQKMGKIRQLLAIAASTL